MTAFDFKKLWASEIESHATAFSLTEKALEAELANTLEACSKCISAGGKILFLGNGGSAADAQHFATEMTVRYIKNRKAIPAIALTTDTSTLTAAGNDLGFDYIFSRQVEALGQAGDILVAISTSGNSANVLEALKVADTKGLITVGFTGKDGGKMKDLCDFCLIIPSHATARIQEMHLLLGHILCAALEQKLGLISESP